MYIKAKYPKVGNESFSYGVQGFGSLYGGNRNSVVTPILEGSLSSAFSTAFDIDKTPRTIIGVHDSIIG